MKIVFPELPHPTLEAALAHFSDHEVTPIAATDLEDACHLLNTGQAAAMVAGIEYDSRAVILACKNQLGLTGKTFSGLAVMQHDTQTYLLADIAACKHPTAEQLAEITWQTVKTAQKILSTPPRVALLSFSTDGSGGKDPTIDILRAVKQSFAHTNLMIDGEMQLDAAINPTIGQKKFPSSAVAGQANVLITPDLNSGNLLYKAFEQIAGYTVAGPILQGFRYPVSDLSRGSSVEDIILTIQTLIALG